jgi:hypothetical protein
MIEITNGQIVAGFDEQSGAWGTLRYAGDDRSLVRAGAWAIELLVDGYRFFGPGPSRRRVAHVERSADGRSLRLVYEEAGLRITHIALLEADLPVLRQSVQVLVLEGSLRKLTAIRYDVPGFLVGQPEECRVQIPGHALPPHQRYTDLAQHPLDRTAEGPSGSYPHGWLETAPDAVPGVIIVQNASDGRCAGVWLYSEEAAAFPTYDGDGHSLSVGHTHLLGDWLRPGTRLLSQGHGILLTRGPLEEHLALFRRAAYGQHLLTASDTPAWFEEARLLQIGTPDPFTPTGTLAQWLPRLDQVRELGFNLIQMMPVWSYPSNCYALLDHYQIDPRVGTAEELRAFVAAAHERGLRVILDLIPQGISMRSPLVQQHPSWLVRDELGRPAASHGWGPRAGEPSLEGTWSLDWGNPDYVRFVLDWALWNVRTFDIDGFRTDAMHHKEPNYALDNPRPAWYTEFGGVRLIEALRKELKQQKPEAVLLSEVWGPIFQRGHDATYEDGWLLQRVNSGWLQGLPRMSGAEWSNTLALSAAARPAGVRRGRFTANHDLWFLAELAHRSPLGDAVSFTHTFSDGFPFVWWQEVEGREAFFRDLLHQRQQLAGYACSHALAHPQATELFTGVWSRAGRNSLLAAANLSDHTVRSPVVLGVPVAAPSAVWASAGVLAAPADGGLHVELPAGAYALISL